MTQIIDRNTALIAIVLTVTSYANAVNKSRCCPENEVLAIFGENRRCLNYETNNGSDMNVLKCINFAIENKKMFNFTINENDQLEVYRPGMLFDPDPYEVGTFCVNEALFGENVTTESPRTTVALICVEEQITDPTILARCMVTSAVFLLATALIYAVIPELRDLQGKSFICLCASLAVASVVYGMQVLSEITSMTWCAFGGFLEYFSSMSAFFWMNAIAIQILRSVRNAIMPNHGWREFRWYALYAWGCPALLTMCVIIANYVPGKHLVPGIGLDGCWFFRRKEQWAYMYSIIAILLFANVSIFVYCSTMLWRQRFFSTNINALRYKFCLSFRLLIVMGLTWILDLASAVHGQYHVIWVIADFINTLQGVLFFLILVLFRLKTIKAMQTRGWFCCLSGLIEKYLSKADDAEENIEHTTVIPLNDK